MNMRIVLAVLLVMGGLALSGCTSSTSPASSTPASAPTDPALAGTSWQLVTLSGTPLAPNTQITLNFDQAAVSGSDGCNQYGGTYTASGGQIAISNFTSTLMGCSEPVMQQASAYTTALQAAVTYDIAGQQLTLADASGAPLATFTAQSRSLSETSWTVTSYTNGTQAVVSIVAGSSITAYVGADGKLRGTTGCNSYTATYAASGDRLSIGPVTSTKKFCADPAGVMEQEAQFFHALTTVATYRIDGEQLELRTADGALAITAVTAKET